MVCDIEEAQMIGLCLMYLLQRKLQMRHGAAIYNRWKALLYGAHDLLKRKPPTMLEKIAQSRGHKTGLRAYAQEVDQVYPSCGQMMGRCHLNKIIEGRSVFGMPGEFHWPGRPGGSSNVIWPLVAPV